MEQLSLPYRIGLLVILVFGALYFVVLKPKDEGGVAAPVPAAVAPAAAPGGTAPGVKGLGTAVDKAKGAAAKSDATNAATQAATGNTTSTPSASTPAATSAPAATGTAAGAPADPAANPAATTPAATPPPAEAKDPSAKILAGLSRGHTAVVLFADTSATDDRAVRRAVKGIDRRDGKVDVTVLPLSSVGRYEAITRGVTITQSPTVLVIGSKRAARRIVGFTTTKELDQLVGDVRAGR